MTKAITNRPDGNPEGKGLNGFLLDWHRSRPRGVVAKPRRQILSEFFTSMLVLSAQFKYKPAVGAQNYLYWHEGMWSLSLIGPDEWRADSGDSRRAGFAGACVLQRDMTWTILPSANLGEETEVAAAVKRFYEAFATMLDTDLTLEQLLPFYVQGMPYYQRLYASAMSRSLRSTVNMGDDGGRPCREWTLPGLDRVLLSNQSQA